MNFSLIICTFKRPKPLVNLLQSVVNQTLYPNEILIIDGSDDNETQKIITENNFKNLKYYKVDTQNRGLTKQRNFGISKINQNSEIVCFLDDDVVLENNYFENIIATYSIFPNALAVGGYITNEVKWLQNTQPENSNLYCIDGYCRKESSRFIARKKVGLDCKELPGFLPNFSHGRSVGYLPPTNKIYEVELFMGGVASYKKEVFSKLNFSTYFDGYGLYEDADFCLRLAKIGKLYVNTAARLAHYHHPAGRPNQFQYGKMVLRNGWYIWRIKNPKPNFKDTLKWHAISLFLIAIRFTNVFNTNQKKQAFTETLGRISGWFSLFISKPKE